MNDFTDKFTKATAKALESELVKKTCEINPGFTLGFIAFAYEIEKAFEEIDKNETT